MKNTAFGKIFFNLLFVLSAGTLQAQTIEFSGVDASGNSLVRAIDDTSYLLYSVGQANNPKLVYYSQSSGTCREAALPSWVRINDMRVGSNDEVYFCGTDGMGNGVVGRFRVQSMFFSGGQISLCNIGGYLNNALHPVSFNRVKLFESGGRTCMAMVADRLIDPTHQVPGASIFSAYFDGTNWQFFYDPNKDNDIDFSDIAVLDDIVVAVGSRPSDAHDSEPSSTYTPPVRLVPKEIICE